MTTDWADPELWPSYGHGCWLCHLGGPEIRLSHTALCFHCFSRWFPGWEENRIWDWLIRQTEKAQRRVKEPECRQLVLILEIPEAVRCP